MADLDAARRNARRFGQRLEGGRVVLLGGCGVKRSPLVEHALHHRAVVEIDVIRRRLEAEIVLMAEHLAFAGRGQHSGLDRRKRGVLHKDYLRFESTLTTAR